MRLFRGMEGPLLNPKGCVATIGNFDGVHLGHQSVITALASTGRQMGLPVGVVLFEPQPREFFQPGLAPARLTRLSEKLLHIRQLPVDFIFLLRFNRSLAGLSPADFINRILIKRLGVRHLVIGDDFRFGRDREGNFGTLQAAGLKYGFSVTDTPSLDLAGVRISSTRLRQALEHGDLIQAHALLGRSYSLHGRVIHGARLGRTLGFPTANISLQRKNLPVSGVFAVTMQTAAGTCVNGVANIGTKPTINGQHRAMLEVHAFDFSADLYGQRVTVVLQKKLRDEQRFADLESLQQQIRRDADQARHYFSLHPQG